MHCNSSLRERALYVQEIAGRLREKFLVVLFDAA
jgi:hypothetical protein